MMAESRTSNSIHNSSMSALAQIVSIVLNFVGRTFFIKLLNVDYLGVNGLFTNILTLLSLAELGVGTAIVYMMYEPIAKGNVQKVAAYNHLFKRIYNIIGCFIFLSGLCVVPFLDVFIKNPPNISENIHVVYILFLLNTSISYFFTYKRSLLIAHQKEYLNSRNIIVFAIIKDFLLIIVLLLTKDYYLYLISQILVTFLSNWSISRVANKAFPEIVNIKGDIITKHEKKTIAKNTLGMVCHKIGAVIVSGTDNILISSFVGIASVGVFSNYKLIQTVSSKIISQAVNAVTASVGNLVASSDNDHVYNVFNKIYFINFTLSFFVAIFFFSIVDSFITIWLGDYFVIDYWAMLIIAANLFLNQIRIPSQIIINSYGIFWQIKWKSIIEAIINLSSSLLFVVVFKLGLIGVLLGTIISNFTTNLWWEPYVAFNHGMHKPLSTYFRLFVKDLMVFAFSLFIVTITNNIIRINIDNKFLIFGTQLMTSTIFASVIFFIVYRKNSEFNFLLKNVQKILKL